MSFEPESMPGQNQYLISYKLPLTFCRIKATSWVFCFPIYLSGDIYSTRANEWPNEENTGIINIQPHRAAANDIFAALSVFLRGRTWKKGVIAKVPQVKGLGIVVELVQ